MNRIPRRICGPKRDEVIREWRKLHNEELHILYSSSNITRQIKSRRMRWTGHVACMERRGKCTGWEIPKEREQLEYQGIDGIKMDLREM
jgi:hypothetical protein